VALLDALTDAALRYVRRFGYPAVAVFTFLETSLLFPLLPSEVVLPFAAAVLVDGPFSFALFVAVATVGSTVGSLFAYYAIGRGGSRVLESRGGYVDVSERELEWSRRAFHRWGETSVLWGRFLPVLRSVISVPAGFARMDVRTFALYTAIGSLLFNALVAAVVYYVKRRAVYRVVVGWAATSLAGVVEFAAAHPLVAVLAAGAAVALSFLAWRAYESATVP
jgi:membrane protein DedA with SNARE-associated domain